MESVPIGPIVPFPPSFLGMKQYLCMDQVIKNDVDFLWHAQFSWFSPCSMRFRSFFIHVLLSLPHPSGSLAISCNCLGAVSEIEDTLEHRSLWIWNYLSSKEALFQGALKPDSVSLSDISLETWPGWCTSELLKIMVSLSTFFRPAGPVAPSFLARPCGHDSNP